MLFLKFPTIDEYGTDGYPSKLFKGFDKVFIKSGETKSVSISVYFQFLIRCFFMYLPLVFFLISYI